MHIRTTDRVLMTILAIMVFLAISPASADRAPDVQLATPVQSSPTTTALSSPSSEPFATPSPAQPVPLTLQVYDDEQDAIVPMDLETYVAHVTAAEMPATYELEALAAQAVAARTLAIYKCLSMGGGGCTAHTGADVCTESSHCQAFLSDKEMASRWGDDAETYFNRVQQAVNETAGLIICYDGEPIEVLYHAASGGQTEDCANVFSVARPYLVSVSSEGESGSAAEAVTTTFSRQEFVSLINKQYPQADLAADQLVSQLAITETSESGRVLTMRVGNTTLTGTQLRKCLSLRSTVLSFRVTDTSVIFTSQGYGHGVGMSQAGAQAMAENGAGFKEILTHYYTGITIESIGE